MIVGHDISQFQSVDWNTYKNNTNFVIIKASEGVGFADPKFVANTIAATQNNIPHGFYHFARPDLGNSPIDEAQFLLHTIGALEEGEVLALDYEVAFNDPVGWCKGFLDEIYNRCQVRPFIYLNQATAARFDWTPVINAGYALWIAAYTYDPNKNDFNGGSWQTSAMQQWTDKQQVPGISGNVDGDVFFGDVNAFKAYGYKAPQTVPDPLTECLRQHDELVNKCNAKDQQIAQLQKQLTDCQNKPAQVIIVTKEVPSTTTMQVPVNQQSNATTATIPPDSTNTVVTGITQIPNQSDVSNNSSVPGPIWIRSLINWIRSVLG